jgi:predicted Rossmann fold nucleotide-binding protein DprA/Smf involved in DNA uptake
MKTPLNVLIAGSRTIRDADALLEETVVKFITKHGSIKSILSGGARGIDTSAERYARVHGIPCVLYPPNWNRYGNSAPLVRNLTMVNAADAVIVIWDGISRGSANTLDIARQAGKAVMEVQLTPEMILDLKPWKAQTSE